MWRQGVWNVIWNASTWNGCLVSTPATPPVWSVTAPTDVGRQFLGLGVVNDPDIAVFTPTIDEDRVYYLTEDTPYVILSDTPGEPR